MGTYRPQLSVELLQRGDEAVLADLDKERPLLFHVVDRGGEVGGSVFPLRLVWFLTDRRLTIEMRRRRGGSIHDSCRIADTGHDGASVVCRCE